MLLLFRSFENVGNVTEPFKKIGTVIAEKLKVFQMLQRF